MDATKHETSDKPKKRFLKRYWSVNAHENVDGNSARACNDSGVYRCEPDYRETVGRTRLSEGEMRGDGSAKELQKVVRSNLQDARQIAVEPGKIRRLSTNVDDNGECAALSSGVSRIRVRSVGDDERSNDQIGEETRVRHSDTKHGTEQSNDQIGKETRVRHSDTKECLRTDNKTTQHLNHKPTSTSQDMPTVSLNNPPLPTNETHSSERIDSTRTNIENASNWDTMKLYLRILIKFWNIDDHYIINQTGILAKAWAPNYEAVPPEKSGWKRCR
ncbi:hypothetical protein THOM_2307 [Trachipleistophora hominis]|uniref:Uncharacterized protein n=1 Tax=Trachipleistophora hominis TaxID=72359 RepID=L7JUP2_TRAHO|nr:hypothetical protein THOM_2307 [Trachipleistophora hominis]